MKETLSFQTEVKQLLQLVIHSLYSNKEIFLRELVSNSADAIDKLRFLGLNDPSLLTEAGDFKIEVTFDPETETITVSDNGIGMTREEIIANLGTIAQSGTREFFEKLTGDAKHDANLIGQFGVGFYSAFIVADKVTVESRKAGTPKDQGVRWESDAGGEFTIETIEKERPGTSVTLRVKEDCLEFLSNWTLRRIALTYSDHVSVPIYMKKNPTYDDDGSIVESDELEVVNQAKAIWTRSKTEISDEEYQSFYKHVGRDFEDALAWTHAKIEGNQEYTHLLYVPSRAPMAMFDADDRKSGVKLYVKRVFIMEDENHKLMPRYLRFVKGVIDSDDLPLNVSREILQENRALDSIRSGCVKKVLSLLEDLRDNEPEKYKTFWNAFGNILKEGVTEDMANQERIAGLLRFSDSRSGDENEKIGLEDYLLGMKENQDKIYYITASNHNEAINSPQLELFKKQDVDVLLMTDRIDEWMVNHMTEYKGKKLVSVTKDQFSGEDLASTEEEKKSIKEALEKLQEENKDVVELIGEDLKDLVKEVRVTNRLTESPACLVTGQHDLSLNLVRMLEQSGTADKFPEVKPILEINPDHFLIGMIKAQTDEKKRKDLSELVYDQSMLAEGGKPHDPALFVKRMNALLKELAKAS